MTAVHVVIPDGIDDPAQPSGGNTYDRRICHGLRSLGWSVHEHAVPGRWPRREAASQVALSDTVQRLDDDAVVLVDGLIASTVPEILVPHAHRLRLVVLVHMPLGHRPSDRAAVIREGAVLSAAAAIVTTSAWTRQLLLDLYRLPADRVHVAEPGVDAADIAPGTAAGGELLCVATLTFDKGQDLLLDALAAISDLAWTCVCVGSLERDPPFARELRRRSQEDGLEGRVCFPGSRTGPDLDRSYAGADLMVLASRAETYGIVVIEALARGLPVIAAEVGGITEALGHGAGGNRPGMLVTPDDRGALVDALRAWLCDHELRGRLRRAALERRETLPGWPMTTSAIAGALAGVAR